MRNLVTLCSNMDPLPEERVLSLRLFYNDAAPSDYQPSHFRDATGEALTTPEDAARRRIRVDAGHVVSVSAG